MMYHLRSMCYHVIWLIIYDRCVIMIYDASPKIVMFLCHMMHHLRSMCDHDIVGSYVNLPMLSVIQVLYSEIAQTAAVWSSRNVMILIYLLSCLTQTKGLVVDASSHGTYCSNDVTYITILQHTPTALIQYRLTADGYICLHPYFAAQSQLRSSRRIARNNSPWSGLVNRSANINFVGLYSIRTSPLSTRSLTK